MNGEGAVEILYSSWNPRFPLILAREENKKWDMFLPNDLKEYKLPQNGKVIYGKMLGSIMAIVKKPNDIDQKKLIASPKLYMDYILTASRMYRYIVGEKIAISSYGEPSRSESHIDTYGRKWLVNYWELPFADSEVISFALPIPGGIFVITRVDSISSIRNGHNHDYAFLSDYVLPSYSGTFAEWKEFLSLSPKDYPIDPILSSMKFSFDSKNIALKAGGYNFTISQKDFAADKDANLDLSLGFFVNDKKAVFDISAVNMYSNSRSDDYTFIRFSKTLRPPEDAPQDLLDAWQQKINQAYPYNAKPYNKDQYTFYDEILFTDDIKKSGKEKINQLYCISLELKQQDRFDEIQKLAAEIKKNLKISVKNK